MTDSKLNISFEVFPPRSEDAERQLSKTLNQLSVLRPSFVSVTDGAGGSTRDRTMATVDRIQRRHGVELAAHLTCVGQSEAETDAAIDTYRQKGLRRIVALRGDASDKTLIPAHPGYADATALTQAIRRREGPGDRFHISVAAYPDGHPKSASKAADLDALVAKFDAGADQAISQFFFMNAPFLRLRDALAKRGIEKSLTAGILPIRNFAQTQRFARRCQTRVPRYISRGFKHVQDDAELTRLFAISLVSEQIDALVAEGVRDFHFYTLNHADMVETLCGLMLNADVAKPKSAPPVLKLAAGGTT